MVTNKSKCILITGANGEVGHGLIKKIRKNSIIIALDQSDIDPDLKPFVDKFVKADIGSFDLIKSLFEKYEFGTVYHLAALLSTSGEVNPYLAHKVNADGTMGLLENIQQYCELKKHPVKFIFPSSIAVYGIPDIKTKKSAGKVNEEQFLHPITMYGINKLYCENLGIYYSKNYKLLSLRDKQYIDFRCVRFPGLISADTTPAGGTSDYAPEILHNAAQNKAYECFVRPDSIIPFMTMPDAVNSLIMLTTAPKKNLTTAVYNVRGFSVSAEEITQLVRQNFPDADISYKINENRQKIIDSWPEDVNDDNAKKDWGWKPEYDLENAFSNYLIPAIKQRYNLI